MIGKEVNNMSFEEQQCRRIPCVLRRKKYAEFSVVFPADKGRSVEILFSIYTSAFILKMKFILFCYICSNLGFWLSMESIS